MKNKFLSIGILAGVFAFAALGVGAQWNGPVTGRGASGSNLAFTNQLLVGTGSPPAKAISATTQTVIDSLTLSALPASCGTNGCRLRVTYDYYGDGGVLGVCWVADSTGASYAQSQALTENNHTPCGATALSPDKFSSGASPTIAVDIWDSGSLSICQYQNSNFTDATCQASGIQGYLQVEVVESN